MSSDTTNQKSLNGYYRWHARIYDLTRWAFLFGRKSIIQRAATQMLVPERILEIGCGTGQNLVELAERFPRAQIVGLDLSKDMLDQARPKLKRYGGRVGLLHQAYDQPIAVNTKFDLVVFSYCLTMINPGFEQVISLCRQDLSERGVIAVVDFHESRWAWFRRWMGVNHVRMDGQVMEQLRQHFQPLICQISHGYGDLWRYLLFVGK
ncbi:S-adenosylmethionine-diacylgycerolhomoserine-N-methlytransferase [Prosthecobacter debontii]|uniref:S-adenosylmethionine-diacylgycerolhomoserine-N-methlytransferase n=1 Tax=Prosthecobacter debontii TaxID=48467 RepID=A0A1T4YDI5_9BACT|nr:class I SAM-dependent methyltransferase [Prosthecobacter debontii]SKA99826.1 S-adenosylmethionine-diacylgycerolhomoserine-N-methlytransferase [Prosthecobacter debontii]